MCQDTVVWRLDTKLYGQEWKLEVVPIHPIYNELEDQGTLVDFETEWDLQLLCPMRFACSCCNCPTLSELSTLEMNLGDEPYNISNFGDTSSFL